MYLVLQICADFLRVQTTSVQQFFARCCRLLKRIIFNLPHFTKLDLEKIGCFIYILSFMLSILTIIVLYSR